MGSLRAIADSTFISYPGAVVNSVTLPLLPFIMEWNLLMIAADARLSPQSVNNLKIFCCPDVYCSLISFASSCFLVN